MSNLKMKEAALIYLDRSRGLQKFIDDCKYYNDSKQSYAVYRFNILINPSDVLELDAELGNHILHHPLKAAQVFQSVCFIAVKTLSLIAQLQTETQINIVLKLTHLPPLPSYILDLCEFPLDYTSQRFYMMQGIVIAMTTITKYTQGARFLCSEEACPLSKDELVNKMNIGNEYKIIGIPACVKSSQTAICIEANSIILCNPKVSSGISENFNCLLSLTSGSCWKFTAILANIFASQIVPPGTYNLLKLCLLMSLVQTSDSKKELENSLDILIITSDTLLVERLLNFSVNLISRGIHHPVSTEIFPTLSRNKYGTGAFSIQAGSALLAKGGICFIGDLCSHKKDKLEQLQSVLESRSITVYIPGKKFGDDIDQQMTFPVQCSFWSFVDMDSSSKRNAQKTNTLIGQMDCSLIPANFVEAFGLLINCNESSPCHPLLPTVQHTLKKATDSKGLLHLASKQFTTEDFEKLLIFAKNLNVEFSLEAERMIHGYYLASRRIRTDSMYGSKLSASALKYLVSLSEAHARLNLRNKVLKEDVLIAALLSETSLTLKYGATAFGVAPNAVFPFELYNEEYLEQRDLYLTQCQQQLQQFIATYGPGIALFSSDE
ncbi:MCM domain-containing protein 2 isoform X3 [Heterocephalus glaber]|uniref:Minichromosome maintenance domain-containing protein 2 n=1 Tax=Heterocephalus glaber TaxID=10181 RepID=A0AAX6SRM7_HETGA|nr:MCM domain-containing protein 2 isoform X3 [Heterocephalus glaber]